MKSARNYAKNLLQEKKEEKIRIMLIGQEGVGKSAMTHRFMHNEFNPDYNPDGTFVITKKTEKAEEATTYEIMDCGNEANYVFLPRHRDKYVLHSDAFVFCFSIADLASFKKISYYYQLIPELWYGCPHPVMLVGLKSDLKKHRKVEVKTAKARAELMGCSYVEVTSKHGDSVEEMFLDVKELVKQFRLTRQAEKERNTVTKSISQTLSRICHIDTLLGN